MGFAEKWPEVCMTENFRGVRRLEMHSRRLSSRQAPTVSALFGFITGCAAYCLRCIGLCWAMRRPRVPRLRELNLVKGIEAWCEHERSRRDRIGQSLRPRGRGLQQVERFGVT